MFLGGLVLSPAFIFDFLGIIIIIKSRLYKSTASFSMQDATLNNYTTY